MTDLLERLAAANPVPDAPPPPLEDLWRKVDELDREARPGRRGTRLPVAGAIGRTVPAVVALVIPIVVVVAAITVPQLRIHHRTVRPTATAPSRGRPTIDPAAQRVAAQQLAGRPGAVVALDPRTGAIRAMYGTTRAAYPPGAAFTIVTAAAALDSGRYRADSLIAGGSPATVSGVPIRNSANESFGQLTLTQALTYSANTVFAQVGARVGPRQMTAAMRRLGFYSAPPAGSAAAGLAPSGLRIAGRLVLPGTVGTSLPRLAIGQGGLVVTPLQMAMVASAVANHGRLVTPRLRTSSATAATQAMKDSTAQTLAQMLRQVVTRGTATSADAGGLGIAGQTGTARSAGNASSAGDLWFVGFAPADHPRIAIAVMLTHAEGFGGTAAAPIAAKVIASLLGRHR